MPPKVKPDQSLSLEALCHGAVSERFEHVLRKVLDDIQDPNTTLGARKVTIDIKLTPDEYRTISNVEVNIKPTLAPQSVAPGTIEFSYDERQNLVATQRQRPRPLHELLDEMDTPPIKKVSEDDEEETTSEAAEG